MFFPLITDALCAYESIKKYSLNNRRQACIFLGQVLIEEIQYVKFKILTTKFNYCPGNLRNLDKFYS